MGVAERLQELLVGQSTRNLEDTAARLGVEELSLRKSIDELSPNPTVEVLAAVIRVYGVDPTWLLTGIYDAGTHRASMENVQETTATLHEMISPRSVRISQPTPERIRDIYQK